MSEEEDNFKTQHNILNLSEPQKQTIKTTKQKLTLENINDKNIITHVEVHQNQIPTVLSARGGQEEMERNVNRNETTVSLMEQNEQVNKNKINKISETEQLNDKVETQTGNKTVKSLDEKQIEKNDQIQKPENTKDKEKIVFPIVENQAVPLERNIFAYKRFKLVEKPGIIAGKNDISIEHKILKNIPSTQTPSNTKNETEFPLSSLEKINKQPKLSRNSKHISLPKLVFSKQQSSEEHKFKHQRASSEVTVSKNLTEKNLDESEVFIGIKEKRIDELNKVRDSLAMLNKKMQKIRDENNVHLETTIRALERNKEITNLSAVRTKVKTIMDISKNDMIAINF